MATRYSTGRRSDSIGSGINGVAGEREDGGMYDVSEAVTGELEGRVVIALEERVSRVRLTPIFKRAMSLLRVEHSSASASYITASSSYTQLNTT